MQLGTRWPVGSQSPSRLPDAVVDAIHTVESEVVHRDTTHWRWTLTWLEGRPVVELDDGTIIRIGHDDAVTVTSGHADTPENPENPENPA
jgi:hypothetical protein